MALTAERLREVLAYDPETGEFRWRIGGGRKVKGGLAGSLDAYGYSQIGVDGRRMKAHRLAWLYVHGREPRGDIDHVNGARADNRMINLRECSHAENQRNMRKHCDNSSGFKGVYKNKHAKSWFAQLYVDGKFKYLGRFSDKLQAAAAYDEAARQYHGDFARTNEVG